MAIRLYFTLKKQGFAPMDPADSDFFFLLNLYKNYVTLRDTVLEIGASIPAMTAELGRWCHDLIGVEVDPARKPQDFANVHYVLCDCQNLSGQIASESINVAFISHVIEHIPGDGRALEELYRVLKPGGVALLSTPNRRRLSRMVLEVFLGERRFPSGEHVREYAEADLMELIRNSPFMHFEVIPIVFGLHGWRFLLFSEKVPRIVRDLANFWVVSLFKD